MIKDFGWFVLVPAITALMQVMIDFDPLKVTDWKLWAVSITGPVVRAVATATIAWFAKNR